MHQVTATGGGGSQQTGSQQSTGAHPRLRKPKQPASAVVGAANESMATATHPVINPRKVFICLSRVERLKSISPPIFASHRTMCNQQGCCKLCVRRFELVNPRKRACPIYLPHSSNFGLLDFAIDELRKSSQALGFGQQSLR